MAVDESRRLKLHDAAREAWGAEAALVLMEMLPPTGWADVATRQQLEAAEARLEATMNHRFDAMRFEFDGKLATMERRIIQWNVATFIGAFAAMTAVVKLT
jgi:hypothetical protein